MRLVYVNIYVYQASSSQIGKAAHFRNSSQNPEKPVRRRRQIQDKQSRKRCGYLFLATLIHFSHRTTSIVQLLLSPLEDHAGVLAGGERHAKLEEGGDDAGEVGEELVLVLGVALDDGAEGLVLDERHVGRQHHEGLAAVVLELHGAGPLAVAPLLAQQQLVVVVGQGDGREGPGTLETAAVGVAAAESVGAGESDDVLVVEAHAVEDGAQVVVALGAIRQAAVRSAVADVAVLAAGAPVDVGAAHLLDGAAGGESPQVGVGDPGEGLLHGLEEVASSDQTGVGAVVALRRETHGGTVGAAGAGLLVVGAGGVPAETEEDGAVGAVIVVILVNELLGDEVVDLLVVLLAGREGGRALLALGGAALLEGLSVAAESVVAETSEGDGGETTDQSGVAATRGLGSLAGVATASLALEGLAGDGDAAGGGPDGGGHGSGAQSAGGHLSGSSHCVCCVEWRRKGNGYHRGGSRGGSEARDERARWSAK